MFSVVVCCMRPRLSNSLTSSPCTFSHETVARGEIRLTCPDLAERARAPASASSLWALRLKRVDETPDSPTLFATRDAWSSVTRENCQSYPGMIHMARIRPSLPFPSPPSLRIVSIQSSPLSRRLHVQLNLCYTFTGTSHKVLFTTQSITSVTQKDLLSTKRQYSCDRMKYTYMHRQQSRIKHHSGQSTGSAVSSDTEQCQLLKGFTVSRGQPVK